MMLFQKKMFASILAGFFIYFAVSIFSCTPPPHGGGTTPSTLTVNITNPEYQVAIGYPGPVNPPLGPGFEVEVTVNTLNSNNQAVFYSTKVLQFPHTSNGPNSTFNVTNVSIPSSGAYVIQYTLKSKDCTSPQTISACNIPGVGSISKKYFKDQHTFTTGGNPGSYAFFCSFANRYYDMCC